MSDSSNLPFSRKRNFTKMYYCLVAGRKCKFNAEYIFPRECGQECKFALEIHSVSYYTTCKGFFNLKKETKTEH